MELPKGEVHAFRVCLWVDYFGPATGLLHPSVGGQERALSSGAQADALREGGNTPIGPPEAPLLAGLAERSGGVEVARAGETGEGGLLTRLSSGLKRR